MLATSRSTLSRTCLLALLLWIATSQAASATNRSRGQRAPWARLKESAVATLALVMLASPVGHQRALGADCPVTRTVMSHMVEKIDAHNFNDKVSPALRGGTGNAALCVFGGLRSLKWWNRTSADTMAELVDPKLSVKVKGDGAVVEVRFKPSTVVEKFVPHIPQRWTAPLVPGSHARVEQVVGEINRLLDQLEGHAKDKGFDGQRAQLLELAHELGQSLSYTKLDLDKTEPFIELLENYAGDNRVRGDLAGCVRDALAEDRALRDASVGELAGTP